MKKIVALVLAMVMVLGLATTAFAAGAAVNAIDLETELVPGFSAKLKEVTAAKDDEFAVYEIVLTAKKNGVKDLDGKDYDKGETATYEYKNDDEFVIVSSPMNAVLAVVDGKTTTWLAPAEAYNDAAWDEKAAMVELEWVDNDAKWDCNAIYAIDKDHTILFMFEGKLYVEATLADYDYLFNVGGMAVPANEAVVGYAKGDSCDYYFNGHSYDCTWKWGVNGLDVEEVYCYCDGVKTTFDFAVGLYNARAKFGDDYQLAIVLTEEVEDASATDVAVAAEKVVAEIYVKAVAPTNYKVLVGAGAATGGAVAPEAGETVTSPKTFDAGIAMYVGMSVMAAAGSAVVLKKKD